MFVKQFKKIVKKFKRFVEYLKIKPYKIYCEDQDHDGEPQEIEYIQVNGGSKKNILFCSMCGGTKNMESNYSVVNINKFKQFTSKKLLLNYPPSEDGEINQLIREIVKQERKFKLKDVKEKLKQFFNDLKKQFNEEMNKQQNTCLEDLQRIYESKKKDVQKYHKDSKSNDLNELLKQNPVNIQDKIKEFLVSLEIDTNKLKDVLKNIKKYNDQLLQFSNKDNIKSSIKKCVESINFQTEEDIMNKVQIQKIYQLIEQQTNELSNDQQQGINQFLLKNHHYLDEFPLIKKSENKAFQKLSFSSDQQLKNQIDVVYSYEFKNVKDLDENYIKDPIPVYKNILKESKPQLMIKEQNCLFGLSEECIEEKNSEIKLKNTLKTDSPKMFSLCGPLTADKKQVFTFNVDIQGKYQNQIFGFGLYEKKLGFNTSVSSISKCQEDHEFEDHEFRASNNSDYNNNVIQNDSLGNNNNMKINSDEIKKFIKIQLSSLSISIMEQKSEEQQGDAKVIQKESFQLHDIEVSVCLKEGILLNYYDNFTKTRQSIEFKESMGDLSHLNWFMYIQGEISVNITKRYECQM